MINLGLNKRPTFFGCNATNNTGPTPLLVYLPNAPYIYQSNTSTFEMDYDNNKRDALVQNGYVVATMGNATVDPQWPACVGCAILSRSLDRTKTKVPDICTKCFKRYCWNGTVNSTQPTPYAPELILPNFKYVNQTSAAPHLLSGINPCILATGVAGLIGGYLGLI